MNTFEVSNANGIARLTLNNPPINTITAQMIKELNEYLNELRNDSATKMVIFQSDNPLFFSLHLDLNVINGSESGIHACNEFAEMIANIKRLDQLTVALVDGVARGGACELAMACDLVFATENAVLAQPEASVNIPPGGQGSVQFARRMGKSKGLYWLLTGADIDAKQAEALNIITQYLYCVKLASV